MTIFCANKADFGDQMFDKNLDGVSQPSKIFFAKIFFDRQINKKSCAERLLTFCTKNRDLIFLVLNNLCSALNCQPGDILEFDTTVPPPDAGAGD